MCVYVFKVSVHVFSAQLTTAHSLSPAMGAGGSSKSRPNSSEQVRRNIPHKNIIV